LGLKGFVVVVVVEATRKYLWQSIRKIILTKSESENVESSAKQRMKLLVPMILYCLAVTSYNNKTKGELCCK